MKILIIKIKTFRAPLSVIFYEKLLCHHTLANAEHKELKIERDIQDKKFIHIRLWLYGAMPKCSLFNVSRPQ